MDLVTPKPDAPPVLLVLQMLTDLSVDLALTESVS